MTLVGDEFHPLPSIATVVKPRFSGAHSLCCLWFHHSLKLRDPRSWINKSYHENHAGNLRRHRRWGLQMPSPIRMRPVWPSINLHFLTFCVPGDAPQLMQVRTEEPLLPVESPESISKNVMQWSENTMSFNKELFLGNTKPLLIDFDIYEARQACTENMRQGKRERSMLDTKEHGDSS